MTTSIHINKSVATYAELPEAIRNQNIYRTGQALSTIFEPQDHLNFDYGILSKNIATCALENDEFKLNAEAFTIYISSVSPRHLNDVFRRVGIELSWDDLGQDQKLRAFLGTTKTRETGEEAQAFLRRFIQTRNKLAHTGNGGIAISDSDVANYIQFFRFFGDCLIKVLCRKFT